MQPRVPDIPRRLNHVTLTKEDSSQTFHECSIMCWSINNLNSVIAIPEISSNEGVEEEGEMASVIKGTVDHVIQHDKEELTDLIMELRDGVSQISGMA